MPCIEASQAMITSITCSAAARVERPLLTSDLHSEVGERNHGSHDRFVVTQWPQGFTHERLNCLVAAGHALGEDRQFVLINSARARTNNNVRNRRRVQILGVRSSDPGLQRRRIFLRRRMGDLLNTRPACTHDIIVGWEMVIDGPNPDISTCSNVLNTGGHNAFFGVKGDRCIHDLLARFFRRRAPFLLVIFGVATRQLRYLIERSLD